MLGNIILRQICDISKLKHQATTMKTVGIIGGGAAGLCALKHVLSSEGLTPLIWEQSRVIGGTWVYREDCGVDEFGLPIHSSMYKNLKTNLPKEVMGFPDLPFKKEGPSFISHHSVLEYLKQYAEYFDLEKHIKFCHTVEEVTPVKPEDSSSDWNVNVRNLLTGEISTSVCQSIIVCNGHYSVPNVPCISGIDRFSGLKDHSHNYRVPDVYKDKTVIVLGASASGRDISLDISSVAKKVYLSHNLPLPISSPLPENVCEISGVESLKENSHNTFVLKNGNEVIADAILYCTGYEYTFPFLSDACEVEVSNNQVWPLYRHLIHCKYPTMAFIGIPFQICPFPYFDIQIKYFYQTLTGSLELPSYSEMVDHSKEKIIERIINGRDKDFHRMGKMQWEYKNNLAQLCGVNVERPVIMNLYEHVRNIRSEDLMNYKKMTYRLKNEQEFERIH